MDRILSAGLVLPFAIFWSTLDRSLILPLVPLVAEDFGVSVGTAAFAVSGHAFAYAGLQLVWGPASARWGRVRILVVSTALAALANVASALAPDAASFIVARTLSGAAFAATFAAVLTYFGDTLPLSRRPAMMSNLASATALGLGVGSLVSGALVTWLDWRWIFALFAVLTAALVPVLARLPEEVDPTDRVSAQMGRVLRNRWVPLLLVLVCVEGFLLIGIFTMLPAILQGEGVSVFVSGLVTSVFGVSVILVSQLMKLVVHRVPAWSLLVAGGACAVVAFVPLSVATGIPPVLAAAVAMGTAWALAHTTLQTWMTDVAADSRALGMTFFSISLMLGGGLGALSSSVALEAGVFPALAVAASAAAGAFAVVAGGARARYPVRADDAPRRA